MRRLWALQGACRSCHRAGPGGGGVLPRLPARGTMAEAIRYALRHREGLLRFLDDGRIELDTNSVERAARPVALGRKNALFAGCDEGAEAWALGRHRLADRDVQAQRCRSAAVPHRPPHPPRRGMAAKPHRRAHAVVLVKSRSGLSRSGPSNPNPSKGRRATLTSCRTRRRMRPTRSISISTHNPNVMSATAEIYRNGVAQSAGESDKVELSPPENNCEKACDKQRTHCDGAPKIAGQQWEREENWHYLTKCRKE